MSLLNSITKLVSADNICDKVSSEKGVFSKRTTASESELANFPVSKINHQFWSFQNKDIVPSSKKYFSSLTEGIEISWKLFLP